MYSKVKQCHKWTVLRGLSKLHQRQFNWCEPLSSELEKKERKKERTGSEATHRENACRGSVANGKSSFAEMKRCPGDRALYWTMQLCMSHEGTRGQPGTVLPLYVQNGNARRGTSSADVHKSEGEQCNVQEADTLYFWPGCDEVVCYVVIRKSTDCYMNMKSICNFKISSWMMDDSGYLLTYYL